MESFRAFMLKYVKLLTFLKSHIRTLKQIKTCRTRWYWNIDNSTLFQAKGLWVDKKIPKGATEPKTKVHWDFVLEEMTWLSDVSFICL